MAEEPKPQSDQDPQDPAEQQAPAPVDPIAEIIAQQRAELAGEEAPAPAPVPAGEEAPAPAEEEAPASAEEDAPAPADPIAEIIAQQKAQLAGEEAPAPSRMAQIAAEQRAKLAAAQQAEAAAPQDEPTDADDEEMSDADREALAQVEAAEAMEAEEAAQREAQAAAEREAQAAAGDDEELSDADREAMAQIEAAEAMEAEAAALREPAEDSDEKDPQALIDSLDSISPSRVAAMFGGLRSLVGTRAFLLINAMLIVMLIASVAYLSIRSSAVAGNGPTIADGSEELAPTSAPASAPASKEEVDESELNDPAAIEVAGTASWQRARAAFGEREYALSLHDYAILHRIALDSPEPDVAVDFFQLRMAQCYELLLMPKRAGELFELSATSKSPVIRGVANYHMAMADERRERYMSARRRGYLAGAAFAGLSQRLLTLETNCDLLIARTLTDGALSFYGRNGEVAWSAAGQADPFVGLGQDELRRLLLDGSKGSARAVLGPQVHADSGMGQSGLWTASCVKAPLSELLGQFATKAKTELRWLSVAPAVRRRSMSVHIRRVSGQRLCELAVGSAGLVVRFTGDTIDVYDLAASESVNQQRDMLITEAGVVWRRLFLRGPRDERIATGHFALALLKECSGDPDEAIKEYQSTARSFKGASVAPQALLRGAKLRIALHDYSGARKELENLLDSYPDYPNATEVYACLGEATMKAGKPGEAFKEFNKLFFLSDSTEGKLLADLGAGRCLYRVGKYSDAVVRLERYITTAMRENKGDLSQACLLLGRCCDALGDSKRAIEAFEGVLATELKVDERIEACLALAEAQRRSDEPQLAKALALSLRATGEAETAEQKYPGLVTAASIYRDMGVPERAAAFLSTNILRTKDPAMRAKLRIELAGCYLDAERFTEAYGILIEASEVLSPGRQARKAACDLAAVCLRMGWFDQAATVAENVLKSAPTGLHRKRARDLLAQAHLARRDYQKAAATMADMDIDELGVMKK